MDIGTAAGLTVALLAVIVSAILEGSHLGSLLQPSAAILVVGGTIGATMVCFPFKDFLALPGLIRKAFLPPRTDPESMVKLLVDFAEIARHEGLLALDRQIAAVPDPLARKGLRLVVDGSSPDLIQSMLETEISLTAEKLQNQANIFETAGGFAPTMGIIGTVLGLVHVLGNLSEPDKLGGAIATAFIATFYGISTANLFWLPLGNKLKNLAKQEILLKELTVEGVLSIQRGDNPQIVREKLLVFLDSQRPAAKSGEEEAA